MNSIKSHPVIQAFTQISNSVFLFLNALLIMVVFYQFFHIELLNPLLLILFRYFPVIITLFLCNQIFDQPIYILSGVVLSILNPNYLLSLLITGIVYYYQKLCDHLKNKITIPVLFSFTVESTMNIVYITGMILIGLMIAKVPNISFQLPFLDSATFMIFIIGLNCYLFYKGIHPNYIHFITYPIMYLFLFENIQSFYLGLPLQHLFTHGAMSAFSNLSGTGITFGIALLDKTLPKETFKSALFGVNEPVIFGLPIADNQSTFIPFVVGGTILGAIPVILMKLGYLAYPLFEAPYIGVCLEGFLVNFDLKTIPVNLLQLGLSILIWYPYYKKEKRHEI